MAKYALRSLARSRGFTTIAVLSLALGLALNTTTYALIDGILHPYVPYVAPQRVFTIITNGGDASRPIPLADRARALKGLGSIEAAAQYAVRWKVVRVGSSRQSQTAAEVSPRLFALLGVKPIAGRLFGDDAAGVQSQPALISWRLWNRYFQHRPLDSGMLVTVGGNTYTIIGVMPRGMHFPLDADIWTPLDGDAAPDTLQRSLGPYPVVRVRRGITTAQAQAEANQVLARLTRDNDARQPYSAVFLPLITPSNWPLSYTYMLLIAGAVLVMACANVGSMMMARGISQSREFAIRIALGARRSTIAIQVLTECACVVIGGLAAGTVITLWALYLVPRVLQPYVPAIGDVVPTLSWRVFAFTAAIVAGTLVLAGTLPAIHAASVDPMQPMKEGETVSRRVRHRYSPLISLEVALSTGLLTIAVILALHAYSLITFHFSYPANRLILASADMPAAHLGLETPERWYATLIEQLRFVPNVAAVATQTVHHPDHGVVYSEEGSSGNSWINLRNYQSISADYFRTLKLPIIAGRDFQSGDTGEPDGLVIVDEAAAKALWPNLPSPVGHMVKFGPPQSAHPWVRVVGVVRSTELQPRHDPELPPEPKLFLLSARERSLARDIIIRTSDRAPANATASVMLSMSRQFATAAPWLPPPRIQRWLTEYDDARDLASFLTTLFMLFGAFGTILSAVGLYGATAHLVSRRQREFALRIALGAPRRSLVKLAVNDAAITVLAGLGAGAVLGIACALALNERIVVFHLEVGLALLVADVLLLTIGVVACSPPVRTALSADAAKALRNI